MVSLSSILSPSSYFNFVLGCLLYDGGKAVRGNCFGELGVFLPDHLPLARGRAVQAGSQLSICPLWHQVSSDRTVRSRTTEKRWGVMKRIFWEGLGKMICPLPQSRQVARWLWVILHWGSCAMNSSPQAELPLSSKFAINDPCLQHNSEGRT